MDGWHTKKSSATRPSLIYFSFLLLILMLPTIIPRPNYLWFLGRSRELLLLFVFRCCGELFFGNAECILLSLFFFSHILRHFIY